MVRIHLPPAKSRANSGTVTLVLDAAPAESRLAELLKPAAASPVAAAVAAPSGNATRVLSAQSLATPKACAASA